MKSVALLLADEHNAYQRLLVREAEAAAARSNIELLPPRFAGGLPERQIEHLFECLHSDPRPNGIITLLVSVRGIQRSIEKVAKARLDWVFLNRVPDFLDQLRMVYPNTLFASVASDQVEIGRIQGRQCLQLLPAGGFVVHVLGARTTPSAIQRQRGFREVVAERVEVHELEGYWVEERAAEALDGWLRLGGDRHRAPDLVVCQNDPMARGARTVLQRMATSLGRSELAATPIIGCDGLPDEGQLMVKAKELLATVVMPPTTPRAIRILSAYWERGARVKSETLSSSSFPPLEQLKRETST